MKPPVSHSLTDIPVVCCDVDRRQIRIALAGDDLDQAVIEEWPVALPNLKGDVVVRAIREFLETVGLKSEDVAICLSVPTYVVGGAITTKWVEWTDSGIWKASIKQLKAELKPKAMRVLNDLVILGNAIPVFRPEVSGDGLLHLRWIGGKSAWDGYPVAVVGVRRGLGVTCLVRQEEAGDLWLAVQSEGGGIGLHAARQGEHDYLHDVRLMAFKDRKGDAEQSSDTSYLLSASEVLSENALRRLVAVVAADPDRELRAGVRASGSTKSPPMKINFDTPNDLVEMAHTDTNEGKIAKKAIQLWGGYMGSFLRDIALAYGALGGVYLEGDLPLLFLTADDHCGARKALNENFDFGGPDREYLAGIPRLLITHPNPYLKGLARLRPKPE